MNFQESPYFSRGECQDCQECGYRGSLVIEDGKLAKKIRKRWLRKKEEKPE